MPAGGKCWRLTERGLHIVLAEYPDENEPRNYMTRVKRSSLRGWERREQMTRVYLQLVRSEDKRCDEVTARASSLTWLAEYEVELGFTEMGASEKSRIVPSATITARGRRYFLAAERSSESRPQSKKTVARYASTLRFGHYRKRFPDELPVTLLLLCRSEQRATRFQKILKAHRELPYQGLALEVEKAIEWLRGEIADEPLRRSAADLEEEVSQAASLVSRLYSAHRECEAQSIRNGEAVGASKLLEEAYEYLKRKPNSRTEADPERPRNVEGRMSATTSHNGGGAQ